MNNNNNNHGNRNNSRGNNNNRGRDTGANSHVKPNLEAMDNSEAYYGDNALHVGNSKGLSILYIVSSILYSPQKTFSLKNALHDESTHTTLLIDSSKHGLYTITLPQLKSIKTTSTPTPPLPTPHHPSLDNVLQIFVKIPTSFIVANNSPERRQAMKEEYDALIKNETWSLVPRASNTNVVDVGSLQYVTQSRPDMAFAVNKVCQYMHAPTENHWSAAKRILRYLHGTVEHGMLIRHSSNSTLQAFTNVLWKGNFDTSREAFSDADWLEIQMIDEAEYKDFADTVVELT
nr:hypothetical protein [Tanacetum cinerariifolium]